MRRKPTRAAVISVVVAFAVGIVFGLGADSGAQLALHLFGYPTACVVIVRFVPVVREQRWRWFILHELAMAAIVLGFVIETDWLPVIPNALWPVSAAVWYRRGSRPHSSVR